MKSTINNASRPHRTLAKFSLLSLVFLSFLIFLTAQSFAQVDPISGENEITATVPDHVAPSTPILISPENNALLNDATPTFVWQGSTDNVGVSHYSMSLDGSILFNNIPTSGSSQSGYTLSYDSGTGYYSLTPNSLISNGSHTWKITAYDAAGNYTDSVTWTFTIDTRAPAFVVEQIGSETVSISAQDLDTIPSDPIRLTENEPLLTGTGEAGSTVQVTIRTPDETETATFTIGSNGKWQLQLGILPRGVIIYLDFVIQDLAGNISVLKDLPILIESPTVVVPPATPLPPGATPLPPGVTPAPPVIPEPPIVIPELSAREWHHKILKMIEPFLPLSLKEIAQQQLIKAPGPAPFYVRLLQWGGLAVILMPALTGFALLLYLFGNYLPLHSLGLLAGLAGIIPSRRPLTGLVFSTDTYKGLPYARIIFSGITFEGEKIFEQTIANYRGLFSPPNLPAGEYVASIAHPQAAFPARIAREAQLALRDYYRGEKFKVSANQVEQQLLIPIELTSNRPPGTYGLISRLRYNASLSRLSLALAAVITFIWPTIWNTGAVGLYLAIGLTLLIAKRFKERGYIITTNRQPLKSGILRFLDSTTSETLEIVLTDHLGQYKHSRFRSENAAQTLVVVLVKQGWQLADQQDENALIAAPTPPASTESTISP